MITEGNSIDSNKVDIINNWPDAICTEDVKIISLYHYRKNIEIILLHAALLTQSSKCELNFTCKENINISFQWRDMHSKAQTVVSSKYTSRSCKLCYFTWFRSKKSTLKLKPIIFHQENHQNQRYGIQFKDWNF